MNKPKYDYKLLKITELLLNSANPRFNPVEQQTEAITAMIGDQQEKLVSLAQSILQFGLNPTDLTLVEPLEPYGKQWLVREGNRRITALKLLNEPELIPNDFPKIKKEFKKLHATLDKTLLENILCVVIDDNKLADEWVRLKHTGMNGGAGTVPWDAQQSSRFNMQTSGNSDVYMLFLDDLKTLDSIPQEYKDRFHNIKKTNFDRLMGDPDVRNLLGITKKNNEETLSLVGEVNQFLLAVLHDLIFENLNVGQIYYKADRRKYLDDLKARIPVSAQPKDSTDPTDSGSVSQRSGEVVHTGDGQVESSTGDGNAEGNDVPPPSRDKVKSQEKSHSTNRKRLVPRTYNLPIQHPRTKGIFDELKKLNVEQYPNAVAVLFRVFIELSADVYIERKSLPRVNENSTLNKKLGAIIDDLEERGVMSKHALYTARKMSSEPTANQSVKTFHAYVHNKDHTPSATDLKSAWDDLWPFIENIWR